VNDSAVDALKGMAHIITRIESLPNLKEGAVLVFEVQEDIDLEIHERLTMAMDALFDDTGIVVIMVPQNVFKAVRAMPLDEVLALRDSLDGVIESAQGSAEIEA